MQREDRGVDLGAQRCNAGQLELGVTVHAITSAEKQAARLLPCTDVYVNLLSGTSNVLILKRLGMSALTHIIDDFRSISNETTNEGWRPPR